MNLVYEFQAEWPNSLRQAKDLLAFYEKQIGNSF